MYDMSLVRVGSASTLARASEALRIELTLRHGSGLIAFVSGQ
jgi:hypothetical protein